MSDCGDAATLAIIAGRGALPRLLQAACVAAGRRVIVVRFAGQPLDWAPDGAVINARFEHLGAMFTALGAAGCAAVVFAGGMTRPNPDPALFDARTRTIAPHLFALLGQGDASVLGAVARLFEAEGFRIEAPHDVMPDLLAEAGVLGHVAPCADDLADIARAETLARALGALDVGQGAVVAQGLCLGLETLQGTDALLEFVATTAASLRPDPKGARGVLFKMPKPGQDLRLDMPAIGPSSVTRAHRAGLAGIALATGGVMLVERAATLALADRLGLFIYAAPATSPP